MPKKTKKKKIEARRHRLQKKQEISYSYSIPEEPNESSPIKTVVSAPKLKKSIFQEQKQSTEFFRNDLLKSLMITMIIICMQVAIYVAQISGTIDITNLIIF